MAAAGCLTGARPGGTSDAGGAPGHDPIGEGGEVNCDRSRTRRKKEGKEGARELVSPHIRARGETRGSWWLVLCVFLCHLSDKARLQTTFPPTKPVQWASPHLGGLVDGGTRLAVIHYEAMMNIPRTSRDDRDKIRWNKQGECVLRPSRLCTR